MPWLDTEAPADPSAHKWQVVLKHAFLRRITADQLAPPLQELMRKHPVSGKDVANILLSFRAGRGGADDPLLFRYAEHLLRISYISTGDLLLALLAHSDFAEKAENVDLSGHRSGLPTCEERIFTLLAQLHMNDTSSTGPKEVHHTVFAMVRWLRVINEREYNRQLDSAGLHTLDAFSCGMYDALGSLAVTVFGRHSFRAVSKQRWWKERRPIVVRDIVNFDTHVLQMGMQSQLSGQLQALSNVPPFLETDADGRPVISAQQILVSITDLPAVHTHYRAGLYVWLNACLCGRPLTDDLSMFTYLQARYAGDNQALAVDLLIASFDVLTNAMLRKESRQSVKLIRSFICNKVPLLLAMFAGYLTSMTAETCIQMGFMQITMDALPPISAGSTDVREMLKRTRMEFLQACALHGIMSETTIGSILSEPPMALPRVTRYSKDGLVHQCSNNVGRLEALAEELQGMQGNAGAVAGCFVEVINTLCISKDTMSLKTVCNILIKRIPDLDIIMQYAQPAELLMRVCSLLNDWMHDQDQTEFTPSYEEFASILLFTLAAIHHCDLSEADVGLAGTDTFVFRLLQNISSNTSPADLSDEQSAHLSRWIEGLFATDEHGETSAISDEVMRQCPPQSFYMLVPTLFEQSVLACRSRALTMTTFKGGLELLLEPFLLPSLIGGLSWLVKHSWENHGDVDTLLQVLDKLLKPSSSSQETQAMHKAVLAMIATPLVRSLRDLLKARPDKRAAHGLVELLKPYVGQKRTSHCSKADLEAWSNSTDGGLTRCVRDSVRDMVAWTSSVGPTPPTKYTHKLFNSACQLLGPTKVLDALLSELKDQTAIGAGAQTLDVCVAMICSPGVSSAQNGRLAVKDQLRLMVTDVSMILDRPLADAEALVRLSRRVEAQLAAPQMAQIPMSMPVQDQTTDQMMQELGLTESGTGASAAGDLSTNPAAGLGQVATAGFTNADLDSAMSQHADLTGADAQALTNLAADSSAMQMDQNIFGDIDMSMTQAQTLQGGNAMPNDAGQPNQEEDIFADLMGDLGDDFAFT